MKKISQVFWVWLLLSLAVYAHADSDTINPNWSELSQAEYVDNLVSCELKLQEYKWSKNIWPEHNKKPKPNFNEVVDVDQVWAQVLENVKMQGVLADYFNTPITDEMLQHDLDRMASNTKDATGLKTLFALFDNNPNTIAQCISRPYLVKQKTLNNYNFNSQIHAKTKTLAQTELKAYLAGDDSDSLKAQVSTLTFEIEQEGPEKVVDDFSEEYIITLSAEVFDEKITQLQNNGLEEKVQAYMYSEILTQSDDRMSIKTLSWPKVPLSEWLEQQSAEIYQAALKNTSLFLPEITDHDKLSAVKAGINGGTWESKFYVPDGRGLHTAVWSGNEMIIWGGSDGGGLNSGGRYDPSTDQWLTTSVGANVPAARYYHTAIWSGSEMIIWGGYDGGGELNSGGRYDPSTDQWLTICVGANVPAARSNHTAIWSGSEMIIWGGYDGGSELNSGGRYDPSTDQWLTTSVGANVPAARRFHTAIWSGSEMIIWGGSAPSITNSLGIYTPYVTDLIFKDSFDGP